MNTQRLTRWIVFVVALYVAQLGSAQAPAGATGQCKDGTYYTGASKRGACRGHQGVKEWYGSSAVDAKAAPASSAKSSTSNPSKSPVSAAPAAASGPAPAGATGLCNDGTYYTGATKRGACRGHKGVKEWYGSDEGKTSPANSKPSTSTPAASKTVPATTAPAATSTSTAAATSVSTSPAPGGGAGKVWLNTSTNVYHCPGTRYYGKTKAGSYMSEAEAKAKGARPDHNKVCQ